MSTLIEHIWVFDENRRVYAERKLGASPIWREHWHKQKVVGETTRSWVTEFGVKVPKKGADPRKFAFSQMEIEQAAYVHENRHILSRKIYGISDYEILRKIADILEDHGA